MKKGGLGQVVGSHQVFATATEVGTYVLLHLGGVCFPAWSFQALEAFGVLVGREGPFPWKLHTTTSVLDVPHQ